MDGKSESASLAELVEHFKVHIDRYYLGAWRMKDMQLLKNMKLRGLTLKQLLVVVVSNKMFIGIVVYSVLTIIINCLTISAPITGIKMMGLIGYNGALVFVIYIVTVYIVKCNSKSAAMIITAGIPIFSFLIIETITGNLFTIQPLYWLINIVILYFIQGISILFCRRTKIGLICSYIVLILTSVIEYYVYRLRGRSFMLQDIANIRTASAVMGSYTYELELRVGMALLCSVVLLYLMIVMPELEIKIHSKGRKICVSLGTVFICNILMSRGVMCKVEFMSFNQWAIEENYQTYGYIRTILAALQFLRIEKPSGYSANELKEIVNKYSNEGEMEYNVQTIQPKNIVMIMNESWADFRCISAFDQDDTITPYIDKLQENTIKGYIYVSTFGAGTANSEYEVLTGNSMQFLDVANTAYQWYISETEWGLARTLKNQKYKTFAFHPYMADNWNRKSVYSRMGFDEFYALENWTEPELESIRWCASDKSSYNKIINIHQNNVEGKLFLFMVTIQNHGGYAWEDYKSTIRLNYDNEYPQAEQYLSLIRETDAAFEYLLSYFETVDEPTLIIMFGDHMPNIEDGFYEELLGGRTWTEVDKETQQKRYMTPFVIWANYDIEERQGIEMSSNYLSSYVLQLSGLDMPDYNKCILSFWQHVPVIGYGVVKDSHNIWYTRENLPDDMNEILDAYQFLQYNNVFGGRRRIDDIFVRN